MNIKKTPYGMCISKDTDKYTVFFAFNAAKYNTDDGTYYDGDSFVVFEGTNVVTQQFGFDEKYMPFDGTFETMHKVFKKVKKQI